MAESPTAILTTSLRAKAEMYAWQGYSEWPAQLRSAADRIDALEAALREIVADSDDYRDSDQNGEAAAARFYGAIARRALEPSDG